MGRRAGQLQALKTPQFIPEKTVIENYFSSTCGWP
jgi:hypothetical protein